jgi:hypothetical protein
MVCPCGNVSAAGNGEGCVNSSGNGSTLRAPDSGVSIMSNDLRLVAEHPPGNSGLLLMNNSIFANGNPVFDGLACVGGGPRLLPGADNGAGGDQVPQDGRRELPGVFAAAEMVAGSGFLVPGTTYYCQYWHRDVLCGPPPAPCVTPCTSPPPSGANFTNSIAFVAEP